MPNPSTEERLKSLTRQEARVLYWKCRGLNHVMIANKLVCGPDRVTQLMSVVYQKLGFRRTMHWTERARLLSQVFCGQFMALIGNDYGNLEEWPLYGVPLAGELVRVGQDTPQAPETKDLSKPPEEPTSDPEMMAMVLEDEKRIATRPQVVQGEIVGQENKGNANGNGHGQHEGTCLSKALRGLGVLALIAAIAGVAYYVGLLQGQKQPGAPVAVPSPIPQNTLTMPPQAPAVMPTNAPAVLPSDTPLPPTALPPTATVFVPPADGILFQDNFDNGFDPAWHQVNGKWITLNGRATIIWEDYFYKWMNIEAPQWQNYRVDADVNRSVGQLIIAVRKRSLGYKFSFHGENCWVYTDDSDPSCIIPNDNRFGEEKAHLQITVQNNQYSASLNGVDTQDMTMTGSQDGGASIGIWCENGFDCPYVDGFRVTYLP